MTSTTKHAADTNWCAGSYARKGLSGHQEARAAVRCSHCGRVIKVRVGPEDKQGWHQATVPRHRPTKAGG